MSKKLYYNQSYIEYYEDNANEHRWKVVAANGEIVGASSEGFKTQRNAIKNFRTFVKLAHSLARRHE